MYKAMERANVSVRLTPVAMSEQAFRTMICGGQYGFTSYMLARFAPEFQVVLYLDGDATLLEAPSGGRSLRNVLYDRMFVNEKCVNQRFHLIESYVSPSEAHRVMQCALQVQQNVTQFHQMVEQCEVAFGHIAARADSAITMDVHHVQIEKELLMPGLQDCASDDTKFKVPTSDFIELHLSPKKKKPECACDQVLVNF